MGGYLCNSHVLHGELKTGQCMYRGIMLASTGEGGIEAFLITSSWLAMDGMSKI